MSCYSRHLSVHHNVRPLATQDNHLGGLADRKRLPLQSAQAVTFKDSWRLDSTFALMSCAVNSSIQKIAVNGHYNALPDFIQALIRNFGCPDRCTLFIHYSMNYLT